MAKYYIETNSYGLSATEEKRLAKAVRLVTNNGKRRSGDGSNAPCVIFELAPHRIEPYAFVGGYMFRIGDSA